MERVQFWRCEKKGSCKARIHTIEGAVTKKVNEHSHESDTANIELAATITGVKRHAGDRLESTAGIINACCAELSEAAYGTFLNVSKAKLKNSVQIYTLANGIVV